MSKILDMVPDVINKFTSKGSDNDDIDFDDIADDNEQEE